MSSSVVLQNETVSDVELGGIEIIEINIDDDGSVKAKNVLVDAAAEIANVPIVEKYDTLEDLDNTTFTLENQETENDDEGTLSASEDEFNLEDTEIQENECILPTQENETNFERQEEESENHSSTLENETNVEENNRQKNAPTTKAAKKPSMKRGKVIPPETPTPCKICGQMMANRNNYLRHLLRKHNNMPSSFYVGRDATKNKSTASKTVQNTRKSNPPVRPTTSETRNNHKAAEQRLSPIICTIPDSSENNVENAPEGEQHLSQDNIIIAGCETNVVETTMEGDPSCSTTTVIEKYVTMNKIEIMSEDEFIVEEEKYVAVNATETMDEKELKTDEENTIIMCDACGKTFRFRSSYRKHVRNHHGEGTPAPKPKRAHRMCHFCGKLCSSGSFRGHMKKHTDPECVTCKVCGMLFSFESVLKSHMKVRHSQERPFKCTQCSSSFKRADYLRSHMRYKHEPKLLKVVEKGRHPYRCEDCNSTFKNKGAYDKHCLKKSSEGKCRCVVTFSCDECDASFKKRNYLILHKRYVHEKKKPFRISETSVGPYKCDRCDRRFASVCGRNYHYKSVHEAIFSTIFSETCDHCGLTFRNRVFYAKHCAKIRDKPTCYLCWNDFDTEALLKEHMHEVHVDDLPFLCVKCDRRFVTLRQLNDHTRSRHANIRPFKCEICSHTSVRKDSLEVHIRSCHLNEKPFGCDLCDKKFTQNSDLRKHRITHVRNRSTRKEKLLLDANT